MNQVDTVPNQPPPAYSRHSYDEQYDALTLGAPGPGSLEATAALREPLRGAGGLGAIGIADQASLPPLPMSDEIYDPREAARREKLLYTRLQPRESFPSRSR